MVYLLYHLFRHLRTEACEDTAVTSARKLAKIHENTAVTSARKLAKIHGNEISIKKMAELHGIKILK